MAWLLLLGSLLVAAPAWADWREQIDACWHDENPNPTYLCYFASGVWRGSRSPRECVEEAVRDARNNDRSGALSWLQACLCPDGTLEQKKAIYNAGGAALEYVEENYGAFVP